MSMQILGCGQVSALGSGTQALLDGLDGRVQPNIEQLPVKNAKGDVTLPVYRARVEGLDRFMDKRKLRRIDAFARMALLSACLAVEDCGLEIEDKSRTGIIVGSGYGPVRTTFSFLDCIIDDGDRGASPTYFANSVHHFLASQISMAMQITGPCTTLTCLNHTVGSVLQTAQLWLDSGRVDHVLAGFGDEYCDVLGYAAHGFGAGKSGKMEPLNTEHCSYLPGEGFVALLLGRPGGSTSGYPLLNFIQEGVSKGRAAEILRNERTPLVLSASGRPEDKNFLRGMPAPPSGTLVYAPLFGSMPVGAAFDLVAAATLLKENQNHSAGTADGRHRHQQTKINCLEIVDGDEANWYQLALDKAV